MLRVPRQPVVRGHPIHAMLSDLPIGLLPAAIGSATLALGRRKRSPTRRTADLLAAMTFAAGLSAAGAGVWDWLGVPRSHPAWWPATLHGGINVANVAMLGAAVALPRRRLPLYAAAAGGFIVAGWLGGELVFVHGWRVKPAEEYEQLVERLEPDDEATLAAARDAVAKYEREQTFLPA